MSKKNFEYPQDEITESVKGPKSSKRSIKQILKHREEEWDRVDEAEQWNENLEISLDSDQAIVIVLMGDPHLDDHGMNIRRLQEDLSYSKHPFVRYVNLGDITNNWVGRLKALWAESEVTEGEAFELAKWFLNEVRWDCVQVGNHDHWNSFFYYIEEVCNGHIVSAHEAKYRYKFPNGVEFACDFRHNFAGHSMWNPVHGASKAAQMGLTVDLIACGHKHTDAYTAVYNQHAKKLTHCCQVGSYKVYDKYAKERGFKFHNYAMAQAVVVDPTKSEDPTAFGTYFPNIASAVEFAKTLNKGGKK
jgi:hypothetical protein